MARVYRIQDNEGRGPWRPGLSKQWADAEFSPGVEALKTWFDEFGHDLIERRGMPGEHYACGVRKLRDIRRWLSATERQKLAGMGFAVVSMKPDRVLAESNNQVVFATHAPLRQLGTRVPWETIDGL